MGANPATWLVNLDRRLPTANFINLAHLMSVGILSPDLHEL